MFASRLAVAIAVVLVAACGEAPCPRMMARADHRGAARACALAFERTGDLQAGVWAAEAHLAMGQHERAAAIAEKLGQGPRAADARRLLGRAALAMGQLHRGRAMLEDSLQLQLARGDHAGAYAAAAALVTNLWIHNDFDEALRFAEIARDEAQSSGAPGLHARSLIALGSVFHAIGDSERALAAYTQASAKLPSTASLDLADVLLRRGVLLLSERQYAVARPLLEQGRGLAAKAGAHELVLAAEVNLADIALAHGDFDVAAAHLQRAEAAWRAGGDPSPSQGVLLNRAILARRQGDPATAATALAALAATSPPPEVAWIIAQERGHLARDGDDLEAAERAYLLAIDIVERMWRDESPEELRAPFFEDRWEPYLSLFSLRLQQKDARAAFAALIAAQGRMFLAESIAAIGGGAHDAAHRRRLHAFGTSVASSPIVASAGAAETLAALGDRHVLTYFSDGEHLRLLVLEAGEVRIAPVSVALPRLESLVDDLLARPESAQAARALGEAILPAELLAAAPRRIHVVPHGALLRVPFAALVTGGQRVLDHHEVVYAPSATALAGLRAGAADQASTTAPGSAVVLGDTRGDLRYVADEVRVVTAHTGATASLGAAATVAALRGAASVTLLHVAGHSGVGVDGGFLVLADGKVGAAEILHWRIRPKLVVLASCASAATNRREMWGSLAVAFLAAGSQHVVATLHSVEDRTAAAFAAAFYRAAPHRDAVAAVAAAQRELARTEPVAAWSAFVVVGL